MVKRQAPYRHADKTGCWTKNCSRGNISNSKTQIYDTGREYVKTMGGVHVDTIAPIEDFYAAVKNEDITAATHPTLPYTIFKYSIKTQYTKNWNAVTMASRGLIINHETGEIMARPFDKFFNYEEQLTPIHLLKGPMKVSEKLDGSLGISLRDGEGRMVINTGGGFRSVQGKWATQHYRENYEGKWEPRKDVTYMWEIIHPENQIVVSYGDERDIHLLGARNILTGKTIPVDELTEWKWKKAETFTEFNNMEDIANAPDRENHEGYIVHFTDTDTRVKVKHDDYVRLHRLRTGVSEKSVWKKLRNGESLTEYTQNVPEEFEKFITDTRTKFVTQYDTKVMEISEAHKKVVSSLPEGYTRKEFVAKASEFTEDFHQLMGYEIKPDSYKERKNKQIWESIMPVNADQFWNL